MNGKCKLFAYACDARWLLAFRTRLGLNATCYAEYLTAEVLELAGNASKDLKVWPLIDVSSRAGVALARIAALAGHRPMVTSGVLPAGQAHYAPPFAIGHSWR